MYLGYRLAARRTRSVFKYQAPSISVRLPKALSLLQFESASITGLPLSPFFPRYRCPARARLAAVRNTCSSFIARPNSRCGACFVICFALSFRRKYFLNADLINQMLSSQVRQMRSFLVIGQVRTDAVDHHHNERAIIHVQPVGAADELIGTVPHEGAIRIAGEKSVP